MVGWNVAKSWNGSDSSPVQLHPSTLYPIYLMHPGCDGSPLPWCTAKLPQDNYWEGGDCSEMRCDWGVASCENIFYNLDLVETGKMNARGTSRYGNRCVVRELLSSLLSLLLLLWWGLMEVVSEMMVAVRCVVEQMITRCSKQSTGLFRKFRVLESVNVKPWVR